MTIAEGEEMIAVTKRHGVLLMYGEELRLHAEISEGKRNGRCRRLRENLSGEAK